VVEAGVTVAEPDVASPEPTPLSMLTLVASVVVHERVEVPPGGTDVGDAVKVIVGGGVETVIGTVAVAVPPGPVAVAT
jgi:hypothetical protein